MADPLPADSPSVHHHKRQVVWQILIPFFVMLALIVTAAVLIVTAEVSQARLWADVSIIWLLAPALFFVLVGIVISAGLIYVIGRLTRAIPRYTSRAQAMTASISRGVHHLADSVTKPILWFQQAGAAVRSLLKKA